MRRTIRFDLPPRMEILTDPASRYALPKLPDKLKEKREEEGVQIRSGLGVAENIESRKQKVMGLGRRGCT